MKPPVLQQLNLEQLPGELRQQLEPLLRQLNPFLSGLSNVLNRRLTFGDNFAAQLHDVVLTAADEWIYPGVGSGPAYSSTNFTPFPALELGFRKRPDGDVELNQGLIATGGSVPTDNEILFTFPAPITRWAPAKDAILSGLTRNGSSKDVFASFGVTARGEVRTRFLTTWFASSFLGPRGSWTPVDRTPYWPSPSFPISYASELPAPTRGVVCVAATVLDPNNKGIPDATTPIGPVWVDWTEVLVKTQRSVKVRGVSGLLPGKSYKLTLLSFAG